MTIATYNDLKLAVTDELLRVGDQTFAARLPRLIAQAERAIERDLRAKEMEGTATLTLTAGQATPSGGWPSNYLETNTLLLLTAPVQPIDMMEEQAMRLRFAGAPSGRPQAASEWGTTLTFAPTPDATYQVLLKYVTRLTPLSDAAPTNAVFARYWDLYLYGTLLASAPGLADDVRIKTWGELYGAALSSALQQISGAAVRSAYAHARAGRAYGKLS
jgi:hypothetical protein